MTSMDNTPDSPAKTPEGYTTQGGNFWTLITPEIWKVLHAVLHAQAAARTRCALKAKFDALTIRKGHKKSVVALAHKMLRTIYAMLSNGSHYQDKEVDYEALNVQRNAPRWIKMLRKHGFIATPAAA